MGSSTDAGGSDEAIVQSFVDAIPSEDRRSLDLELRSFVVRHSCHHRPIALVSSGGTAADLEVNSVRCLDNFSTGKRGAISVEGEISFVRDNFFLENRIMSCHHITYLVSHKTTKIG
jgi:hypothetical protein